MHQPHPWPQQPPRRHRRWQWLAAAVTVVAVVVVLLGFTVWNWGATRFTDGAVEAGVVTILRDSYGIAKIGDVRCPSGELVEAGNEFTCQVEVDGKHRSVRVRVIDAAGTYEVSRP